MVEPFLQPIDATILCVEPTLSQPRHDQPDCERYE